MVNLLPAQTVSHKILSDPELYALCKKWGAEALEARRKFIGLLPEVCHRRLYERRDFTSIYHFAARLGGVGERLVNEVLRLEKRFRDLPNLHAALVNGEIGLSKLSRVAAVVNPGNEAEICARIRTLSRRAVDVLVRDLGGGTGEVEEQTGLFEKIQVVEKLEGLVVSGQVVVQGQNLGDREEKLVNQTACSEGVAITGKQDVGLNGLCETINGGKSLAGQSFKEEAMSGEASRGASQNHDFEIIAALSPEVKAKLKELIDRGIDINSLIMTNLSQRDAEIAKEKANIGEMNAKSRYVPAQIKKILIKEFGHKCAHKGCPNPAREIHHEKVFFAYNDHDPRSLKPLCRGHHELEHL